LVGARLITS